MDEEYYRKAPPPLPPLWEGIYSFPGRPENIAPWLILTVYLTLIACFLAWLYALLALVLGFGEETVLFGGGPIVLRGGLYVFIGCVVLTVFFSIHVGIYFSRVVEDTAAGIDEVGWPKEPWLDNLGKPFFFFWLLSVTAVLAFLVGGAAAFVIPGRYWLIAWGALIWFLFPLPLYSTMSAGSPWMIFEPVILGRLLQRPLLLLFLYLNSLLIFVVCFAPAYPFIVHYTSYWWLTPIIGVIWSTMLLSYGRVLGRVAYALTREKKRPKKRRKRPRAEESDSD
jgi:hypothetical protein